MKKIGLFYGTETVKTAEAAAKIQAALGNVKTDIIPVEKAEPKDFEKYELIIAGVSTWFDGELPTYWDEIIPALKSVQLNGKKVAIFGLGDQVNYPDNFADGVGMLADIFEKCGATLTGFTLTTDYQFNQSLATRGHQFAGLILDFENQAELTDERIKNWVEQLKQESGVF